MVLSDILLKYLAVFLHSFALKPHTVVLAAMINRWLLFSVVWVSDAVSPEIP